MVSLHDLFHIVFQSFKVTSMLKYIKAHSWSFRGIFTSYSALSQSLLCLPCYCMIHIMLWRLSSFCLTCAQPSCVGALLRFFHVHHALHGFMGLFLFDGDLFSAVSLCESYFMQFQTQVLVILHLEFEGGCYYIKAYSWSRPKSNTWYMSKAYYLYYTHVNPS